LNIVGINFCHENVKCYELKQVIGQKFTNLINILNRFRTTSHTFEDINFINNFFKKPPPIENTLSHLFDTNTKTTTHNKRIFEKKPNETFKFAAQDIHLDICPCHFKLSMLPSQTSGLCCELFFKKTTLVEIVCWKCNIKWSCQWDI